MFSSIINFKQRIYHGVDITHWDFQGYSGKESTCQFRRCKLIPGSGKSPGGGNGNPIQYSCLEILWPEEPGGLQSIGSQRVGHDWATEHTYTYIIYNILYTFLFLCKLCFKCLAMLILVVLVYSFSLIYSVKFEKYTAFICFPADGHLGHSQCFSIEGVINLFVMSPCEYLQSFSRKYSSK